MNGFIRQLDFPFSRSLLADLGHDLLSRYNDGDTPLFQYSLVAT